MPAKTFFKWSDIDSFVENIVHELEKISFIPNIIISIGRGGMIPTRIMSDYFLDSKVVHIPYKSYEIGGYQQSGERPYIDLHGLDDLSSNQKILLVDDISDSGSTLKRCKNAVSEYIDLCGNIENIKIKTSAIVTKKKWLPDIAGVILDNERWIVFPWEKNEFGSEGK